MKSLLKAASLAGALLLSSSALADIIVVGHPALDIQELTKTDVRNIYLNKPSGNLKGLKVKLTVPNPTSDAGKQFFKQVMRMRPGKFKSHWATQIFTGKGVEPTYTNTPADVVNLVLNTPNTIGVMDENYAPKNVKILFTLGE